jgi:hypothetical protein
LSTTVTTPVTNLALASEYVDRAFNAPDNVVAQLPGFIGDIAVYSPPWLS